MIFLDNAGTTKMFKECLEVYEKYACEHFFNPSAMSAESVQVAKEISDAEKFFLKVLGASEGNVLFTGCATESNNLAIRGSIRKGEYEYVFSAGEHPSVYNVAKKMELEGFKVHFVPLCKNGEIDLKSLESVLNEKTRLISIMFVNNETGAINDLEKISRIKKRLCPKAVLHVDGVQGFMKIPVNMRALDVDLFSFSAHKIHGPKGVAGLYVKNKGSLKEFFEGGGQQYGLRSGTENVPGIMQFKKAVELIDIHENYQRAGQLKNAFKQILENGGVKVLDFEGSPYILNVAFEGVKGETMLHALNQNGVIIGLGSACSAKKAGNRVLEAIGVDKTKIVSSARISFSAYQNVDEIENAAKIIVETYKNVKERVS